MVLKPPDWIGSPLDDWRAFPTVVRQRAGFELYRVQQSLEPTDWKPIDKRGAWRPRNPDSDRPRAPDPLRRQFFAEAIYILHAFEKKSRATPRA